MILKRIIARCAAALLSLGLLSSCWLPDQFEAEVRFTSTGLYGVTYRGILTYAPLFSQIARKEIEQDVADRQIAQFLDFLEHDSAFSNVKSLGRGRYDVTYTREGQFEGTHQTFNFVSRQGTIFRLRTTEDGRITFAGSGQAKAYAARFEQVGLTMQGLLRVTTDAEVMEHNATRVRASATPGFTMYDWDIRSLRDTPPRLIAKLKVDPRTGVPAYGSLGGSDPAP